MQVFSIRARGFLFVALSLIVLNPYTSIGPLGFYATAPFLAMALSSPMISTVLRKHGLSMFALFTISVYAVFISSVNNIFQLAHLYVTFSMMMVIIAAVGIWNYCCRNSISFDGLLMILLWSILLNSIVISIELIYPEFRALIEANLVQLDNNYLTGNRFRGIASSGGAALSVLYPVGLAIAFHLYIKQHISVWAVSVIVPVLILTSILIGRTGLVLSVIPIIFFIVWLLRKSYKKFLLIVPLMLIVTYLLFPFVMAFLGDQFGESFIFYSVEFLFEEGGIESEGTIPAMKKHWTALPSEWPYFLTGYGYYGYGNFESPTDSGMVRMFLAVGYLLGAVYYLIFFRVMSLLSNKKNIFVLVSGFSVLLVAELKETILFSQFTARLMIIVAVYSYLDSLSQASRSSQSGCVPIKSKSWF